MSLTDYFAPIDLLIKGGWVMFVILGCSIASLTIIISKGRQFWSVFRHDTAFINDTVSALHRDGTNAALAVLESSNHPVARIMETTLDMCKSQLLSLENIEKEIIRTGSLELRKLDKGLRGLCALAQITPILGLLGTVTGMIAAFIVIQDANTAVNPALLAGGIWEALLTTAFALIVAIPTMGAYYYFEGLVDDISSLMSSGTGQVLLHFKKSTPNKDTLGTDPQTLATYSKEAPVWKAHANY